MLKWTVTKRPDDIDGDGQSVTSSALKDNKIQSRRSLGAINQTKTRTPRINNRRSLGSCTNKKLFINDKENTCMTSTPYRVIPQQQNTLAIALRDVSNLTPQSTPIQPSSHGSRKRQRPPQYASTLPTFDIEYSPTEAPFFAMRGVADSYYENPRYFNNGEDAPPLKRSKQHQPPSPPSNFKFRDSFYKRKNNVYSNFNNNDQSMSSSLLGDTALEQMIDAILESAKKEKPTPKVTRRILPKRRISSDTPTYTAADDPANDLKKFNDHLLLSPDKYLEAVERTIIIDNVETFNEREVKTPESLSKNNNIEKEHDGTPLEVCCLKRRKAMRRKCPDKRIGLTIPNGIPSNCSSVEKSNSKLIGLTLPNGIPSPGTPQNLITNCKNYDELAEMDTPRDFAIIVDSNYPTNKKPNNNCSTTPPEIQATDLQGSSTPTGDVVNGAAGIRRCLTFSPDISELSIVKRQSVASSTTSSASSSSRTTCSSSATTKSNSNNFCVTGSLDLALFASENGNKINVHVIRCRDLHRSSGSSINAYVKVAILPNDNIQDMGFQRTAVHRNSTRPYFDHRFTFDIKDNDFHNKRIQLAVWHRDRECKRSEFLGCMSFPVKNVLKKEINGSFKLQPQICLTNPQQPVPMGENSQSSVEEIISIDDGFTVAGSTTNVDGGISASYDQSNAPPVQVTSTIAFSKKAMHQRDADENLFLRFLELDPVIEQTIDVDGVEVTEKPSSSDDSANGNNTRQSCSKKNVGRTPFTITKRLIRTEDKGYGFSIVWTHPPRIEKVESGLSADRCGILPGDYVIFVENHNVVTMPEMDILNLIRSQGNNLILEIFRRPNSSRASGIKTSQIISHVSSSDDMDLISTAASHISHPEIKSSAIIPSQSTPAALVARRSSMTCSNSSSSMGTSSKRRLHLPKLTFSKDVGRGVIV